MAVGEAFLSAFLQVLFDRLASREFVEIFQGQKLDGMLEKLKIILLTITAVLNDAERKQFNSLTVQKWLHMAKFALYDAEDVLDELAYNAFHCKLEAESQTKGNKVRNWNLISSSFNPFHGKLESKIKSIIEKLDYIAKQKDALGLNSHSGGGLLGVEQRLPSTSLMDESSVFGRKEDKETIMELLLQDEVGLEAYGVIPIVGMGGIGKTTLAQLVYNDDRLEKHFDFRVWICVSDQFNVLAITKTILKSVTLETSNLDDLNLLQVILKKKLKGKRILIVLDDVWTKQNDDWDVLWRPLKGTAEGSKIVVTTRNKNIASGMGTVPTHQLECLPFEDCWSVFTRQAFGKKDVDSYSNLKGIGREIVNKCEGLPLAAKRLGVLLRSRLKEDKWREILDRKMWELPDDEKDLFLSLRLSYEHLPPHLKQCFAYCSIFPQGYEFERDSLVLLWMAEGFVQQPQGDRRLEDVGAEYFNDLVSNSMFQHSSHDNSRFVMHGSMKELAEFVSGELCFRMEDNFKDENLSRFLENARHSSYIRGTHDLPTKFEIFHRIQCLRTFLPLDQTSSTGVGYLPNSIACDLLPNLPCLRVLSFNGYRITELPNSIGALKHLRYLDLSHTAIKELPKSTGDLYNLETLILLQCRSLTNLPADIGNLLNLRHLWISGSRIREMPPQMCRLDNLQTLSNYVVGENSEAGITGLRGIVNVNGALHISGLKNVRRRGDAMEANLKDKQALEELVLQWGNNFSYSSNGLEKEANEDEQQYPTTRRYDRKLFPHLREAMEKHKHDQLNLEISSTSNDSRDERVEMDVLEMLQPHKNIKRLTISHYGGTKFPGWIGCPYFSNMVLLKLSYCKKCKSLPPLGQLYFLKDLTIEGMEEITSVGPEFYGDGHTSILPFPSLETLKFDNMPAWEDWFSCGAEDREDFGQLQKIEITDCPKLKKLSHHFSALRKMCIIRCEDLEALQMSPLLVDGMEEGGEKFPCLHELSISACPNLKEFPEVIPSLRTLEIDGCPKLEALPHLPFISELEIKNCDEVVLKSVAELTSPAYLTLCRLLKLRGLENGFFRQLTALKELQLAELSELVSLSNEIELSNLPKLQRMAISECPHLVELPQNLHNIISLKEIRISVCPRLVSFPKLSSPAMLKSLEIHDCETLESLPECLTQENTSTSLEYLVIKGCPSLSLVPNCKLPSTLKVLEIKNCMKVEFLPEEMIHTNSSLEYLEIVGCNLKNFPIITFTELRLLVIKHCTNLESLPEGLHNLAHLENLEISGCSNLQFFPPLGLPSPKLQSIKISSCENLKSLPNRIHRLTSLEQLSISNCSSLISLPDGGFPRNLISLSILDCENLKPSFNWGLHRLTALTHFYFGGCQALISLPEEWLFPATITLVQIQRLPNLKCLPKGLEHLASSGKLDIWECDNLQNLPEEEQPEKLLGLEFWDVL